MREGGQERPTEEAALILRSERGGGCAKHSGRAKSSRAGLCPGGVDAENRRAGTEPAGSTASGQATEEAVPELPRLGDPGEASPLVLGEGEF